MSNILGVELSGGKDFTPVPPGKYDAVLQAVIQLGIHTQTYEGKEKPPKNEIKLIFELADLKDDNGVPRSMGKKLTTVMNEKANFFKTFKAMGIFKECTSEEVTRVFGTRESLEGILGTSVSLTVSEFNKLDGTSMSYIESIIKLDPRLPQPVPELEPLLFLFAQPDIDVFKNKLTRYTRKEIMEALNSKDLPKEFHEFYMIEVEEAQTKEKPIKSKPSNNGVI